MASGVTPFAPTPIWCQSDLTPWCLSRNEGFLPPPLDLLRLPNNQLHSCLVFSDGERPSGLTTDENKSSDASAFTVLQTQEQSKPKKTPPTSQQSLNSTTSSSKFNSPPILKHSHKKVKITFLDEEDGEEENKESLRGTEEQYESTESLLPMASILNVAVDYYMSEPTPLEPEEFQWKLMMRQKRLKQS